MHVTRTHSRGTACLASAQLSQSRLDGRRRSPARERSRASPWCRELRSGHDDALGRRGGWAVWSRCSPPCRGVDSCRLRPSAASRTLRGPRHVDGRRPPGGRCVRAAGGWTLPSPATRRTRELQTACHARERGFQLLGRASSSVQRRRLDARAHLLAARPARRVGTLRLMSLGDSWRLLAEGAWEREDGELCQGFAIGTWRYADWPAGRLEERRTDRGPRHSVDGRRGALASRERRRCARHLLSKQGLDCRRLDSRTRPAKHSAHLGKRVVLTPVLRA